MAVMDGSCWEGKTQIRTWDSWCQWRQFFASQLVTKKDKVQQVNPHREEHHPATQTLATNHHLLWRSNWLKGRSHRVQSRAVWTAISVNTVTVFNELDLWMRSVADTCGFVRNVNVVINFNEFNYKGHVHIRVDTRVYPCIHISTQISTTNRLWSYDLMAV